MTIQGTPEWFAERCGKVTASRIADIIAKTKSGESASRANYRAQLVAERLTGQVAESYTNGAMARGTETEPLARLAYEARTGVMVEEVGFVPHPTIAMAGASPDGLVDDGLIEIKCPNTATHINYLLGGVVPEKYKSQMAWQCACTGKKWVCTGKKWVDFVSFDDRLGEDLQLFIVRYIPEPEYIAEMEKEVVRFLAEVDDIIKKLEAL